MITVGEISKGIAKRRRNAAQADEADSLQSWLEGLLTLYADRILPVDVRVASRWGMLCDEHPELATDMLIAATALENDLSVATRNEQHFRGAGVRTVNPFD